MAFNATIMTSLLILLMVFGGVHCVDYNPYLRDYCTSNQALSIWSSYNCSTFDFDSQASPLIRCIFNPSATSLTIKSVTKCGYAQVQKIPPSAQSIPLLYSIDIDYYPSMTVMSFSSNFVSLYGFPTCSSTSIITTTSSSCQLTIANIFGACNSIPFTHLASLTIKNSSLTNLNFDASYSVPQLLLQDCTGVFYLSNPNTYAFKTSGGSIDITLASMMLYGSVGMSSTAGNLSLGNGTDGVTLMELVLVQCDIRISGKVISRSTSTTSCTFRSDDDNTFVLLTDTAVTSSLNSNGNDYHMNFIIDMSKQIGTPVFSFENDYFHGDYSMTIIANESSIPQYFQITTQNLTISSMSIPSSYINTLTIANSVIGRFEMPESALVIDIKNTVLNCTMPFIPKGVVIFIVFNASLRGELPSFSKLDAFTTVDVIDLRNNFFDLCTGFPKMGPKIRSDVTFNSVRLSPQYNDITCYCVAGNCLTGSGFPAYFDGVQPIYQSAECSSNSKTDPSSSCFLGYWTLERNLSLGAEYSLQNPLSLSGNLVTSDTSTAISLTNSSIISPIVVSGDVTIPGQLSFNVILSDKNIIELLTKNGIYYYGGSMSSESGSVVVEVPLIRSERNITTSSSSSISVSTSTSSCFKVDTTNGYVKGYSSLVSAFTITNNGCNGKSNSSKLSKNAVIAIAVSVSIVVVIIIVIALLATFTNTFKFLVRPFSRPRPNV